MASLTWLEYFQTPAGQTDLVWQEKTFARFSINKNGDRALQVAMPEINALTRTAIRTCVLACDRCVSRSDDRRIAVLCSSRQIPFADASFDLITWPHGFDATSEPNKTLSEIVRLLAPNGILLTTFFNDSGSWALLKKIRRASPLPTDATPIGVQKAKSFFDAVGLTCEEGHFGVYGINKFPTHAQKPAIEKAGDRWWPTLSNIVFLAARKNDVRPGLVGKVTFSVNPVNGGKRALIGSENNKTQVS